MNKTTLREKIVKAVPEIRCEHPQKDMHGFCETCGKNGRYGIFDRPITLADVLRAIDDPSILVGASDGFFYEATPYGAKNFGAIAWNLSKDSLDDQSPETLKWLNEILP